VTPPVAARLEDAPEQIDRKQNENDDDQDRDDAHRGLQSVDEAAPSSPGVPPIKLLDLRTELSAGRGGSLLQPLGDFVGSRFAGGDRFNPMIDNNRAPAQQKKAPTKIELV
jgi:hypothetical protein